MTTAPDATTPAPDREAGGGWLALFLALMLVALAVALALATAIGDYRIGLGTVVLAVTNGLGLTGAELPPIAESVVWDLRLSRALVAALAEGVIEREGDPDRRLAGLAALHAQVLLELARAAGPREAGHLVRRREVDLDALDLAREVVGR